MGNYTTPVQNLIMELATNEQDHVLGIQYYLGMSHCISFIFLGNGVVLGKFCTSLNACLKFC